MALVLPKIAASRLHISVKTLLGHVHDGNSPNTLGISLALADSGHWLSGSITVIRDRSARILGRCVAINL
jgi:hypothetical protein